MEPNYEVLGAQIVSEMMGADPAKPGFDAAFGINAAAELLSRGVNTYQNQEDAKKNKAANEAALARALQADVGWANAEVMLAQANQSKDPQKIAAAQAICQNAQSASMVAGSGLSPESMAKRLDTANDMAKQAAEKSFATPSNPGFAAAMQAWQKVASAVSMLTAQAPGGSMALELAKQRGGSSFLDAMKKKYAGVPLGGWLIGVPVAGGLIALIVRALRRKK